MSYIINPFRFDTGCPPFVPTGAVPSDYAGLIRWYEADSFDFPDGTSISDPWTDLSASLSNATPSVGFEPVFNTEIFGCRPAIFMGINGVHNFAFDSGAITLTDFTILAVTIVVSDSLLLSNTGANRQVRISRTGGPNQVSFFDGSGEIVSPTLTYSDTDPRLTGWKRSGTTVSFYENDLAVAGGNTGSAAAFDQIGLKDGGPLNLYLGSIAIFTSPLADADVLDLYNDYYKPKFGLLP